MILDYAPLDDLLGMPPWILRYMLEETGDSLEALRTFEPVTWTQELVRDLEHMALKDYRANLIRALEAAGETT